MQVNILNIPIITTHLVQPACEIYNNLASSVIIDDLKLANVTWKHTKQKALYKTAVLKTPTHSLHTNNMNTDHHWLQPGQLRHSGNHHTSSTRVGERFNRTFLLKIISRIYKQPQLKNPHSPCFIMTVRKRTITLEQGLMRTWRFPRFSALLMLFSASASTFIRTMMPVEREPHLL